MQEKIEFDHLAYEIKEKIAENASAAVLRNLAETSATNVGLFKPMFTTRALLSHVVCGSYDAVCSLLAKDIRLMTIRGKVEDCSGRIFKPISAFEYTLWALDKHMWTAMMACIPQNEKGRKFLAKLTAQYNRVKAEGLTYTLNGQTITEQHFDFENTIIKELQAQVDAVDPGFLKPEDWEPINEQWRKGVGGAQKLLPMHVVHEYCSNKSFLSNPDFSKRPETPSRLFYSNDEMREKEDWFSPGSQLGVGFAIYKAADKAVGYDDIAWSPSHDLAAIKKLY